MKKKLRGFSEDKEISGCKWFHGFMKHHDELCVKNCVTHLYLAHALGSSQCIIDQWFDMYQSLLGQFNITDPKYAWNIGEHGMEDMVKVKRHKAVSDATQGKAKVDNHANICQCCRICFAPYGYPQGEYHDSWHISAQPCVLV